jgi:outer membrane protein TolC
MPLFRNSAGCTIICVVCAMLTAGCSSSPKQAQLALREPPPHAPPQQLLSRDAAPDGVRTSSRGNPSEIKTVSHEELLDTLSHSTAGGDDLFAGHSELTLPALVSEVQQRNPSLQAALAAWGAAAEKPPQAEALDDPMLQTMAAPGTFASSSSTQSSYIIAVGQKLPWSGKRGLRGQVAQWNAVAASLNHAEIQLRLAEAARLAYYDYYYVFRQMELNEANLAAVKAYRDTARSKFEANQVSQQDLLQAEVELARTEQMQVEIEKTGQVATARINQLLHRDPQLLLPPPPSRLEASASFADVDVLREQALERRPDLAAIAAKLHSEQNALALACKEYYPDFEVMGKYDSFWTDVVQRGQVALNLNIPLNQSRRGAAVREALFNTSRIQAEYNSQVDLIKNEVQTAYARLEASRRTLKLFEKKLLPATEANVSAAASGYTAGTVDFLRLVQAQREFLELNEKYQQAVVEFHRNRAELDRVVATPVESGTL